MSEHILLSDTQSIESKHSGRYVASFLYDVGMIQNLISTGFLNIMKDKGFSQISMIKNQKYKKLFQTE